MSWRARLSMNIREIVLVFCPKGESSAPMRAFVCNNYAELKRLNPKLPILVRPCQDHDPRMIARYDYGMEASREMKSLSEERILETLQELNLIGAESLRANVFEWQEGVPKDVKTISYEVLKWSDA